LKIFFSMNMGESCVPLIHYIKEEEEEEEEEEE
jgi:hypothetical protein